jgi:multidrug efflux pump subunit AcrA (membrane-fusion protein)
MGIDPATIAIVSSVASGVTGFIGAQQQASAAKAQAEYNAAVARNNAIYAERAAKEAEERGRVAEMNQRQKTANLRGRQRAVLAANGVDVNDGSALDIQQDTSALGAIDALTIRSNAEREALGFRQQGQNFGGEAALYDARARSASSNGFWSGAGSLLGSAGTVAEKWYRFSNAGARPFSGIF